MPDLYDFSKHEKAIKLWGRCTDHVLCSLPFEVDLLHAAGYPATFVGHPLVQSVAKQLQAVWFRDRLKHQPGLFQQGNAKSFLQQHPQLGASPQQGTAASSDQPPVQLCLLPGTHEKELTTNLPMFGECGRAFTL